MFRGNEGTPGECNEVSRLQRTHMNAKKLLTLKQAASIVPCSRGDAPVRSQTVARWITTGGRAADGSRIRLQAFRYPSGWRVTEEALAEFIDRLTQSSMAEPTQA